MTDWLLGRAYSYAATALGLPLRSAGNITSPEGPTRPDWAHRDVYRLGRAVAEEILRSSSTARCCSSPVRTWVGHRQLSPPGSLRTRWTERGRSRDPSATPNPSGLA
jgi:hypothetical protein